MAEAAVSFYDVLGLARDAEPKAIRKAYFAKVREFPPETHPAEFKRVREAYETLSNPQTRQQYDETLTGGGREQAATQTLQAAIAAWQAGDLARAERTLAQLLLERRDLTIARQLLARVFVSGGKVKQALPIYEALCREDAGNPLHHLHHGHAWRAAGDLERALAAYRRAAALDRTDPELLLALADCLVDQGEYEPALAELDRGVGLDGKVDFEDLGYFLRKLQVQYLRARAELAEQELAQIAKVVPGDLPTRRYVTSRLLAIAAGLFARKQAAEALSVVAWCRKIDPTRKSLHMELPVEATVEIARLPTASKAWLRDAPKDEASCHRMPRWGQRRWYVLAALYAWIALSAAFGVHPDRSALGKASTAIQLMLAGLALAWLVSQVLRVTRNSFGRFLALHPFHLVRCEHDEVTIWPLLNLSATSVLHNSHNGSYTHSVLTFEVGGAKQWFEIADQATAERLGQRALDQRRRILELMAANQLEQEKGFDFIPPALLEPRELDARGAERRRARLQRRALGLCAGLALFGLSIPYSRRATERAAFQQAQAGGIPARRDYLRAYPVGRFADTVRGMLRESYDQLAANYRAKARSGAPGAPAVLALLEALRDATSADVAIAYEASIDLSEAGLPAGAIDPRPAFEPTRTHQREQEITFAIKSALGQVFTQDALRIVDESRDFASATREEPAATFLVRYRIAPSGEVYTESSSGKRLVGIAFDWTFTIRAGTDGAELGTLSFRSNPASRISYAVSPGESNDPVLPYTKMAGSGFDDFRRRIISQLGLGPEVPDEDAPSARAAPLTPQELMQQRLRDQLRARQR